VERAFPRAGSLINFRLVPPAWTYETVSGLFHDHDVALSKELLADGDDRSRLIPIIADCAHGLRVEHRFAVHEKLIEVVALAKGTCRNQQPSVCLSMGWEVRFQSLKSPIR